MIIGRADRSQIATLVERRTHYVLLLGSSDGRTAERVRTALAEQVLICPSSSGAPSPGTGARRRLSA